MSEKIKNYLKARGVAMFMAVLLSAIASWAGTYSVMEKRVSEAEDKAQAAASWADTVMEEAEAMVAAMAEEYKKN
jgi:hypothetical protein